MIETVKEQGGIEYAQTRMRGLIDEALLLLEDFEDTIAKEYFISLVDYVTKRKHWSFKVLVSITLLYVYGHLITLVPYVVPPVYF